jgi:hypothetical protein
MTRAEIIYLVENTFIGYAIKNVSKTDVEKGAYLPNKEQRDIMSSLGLVPIHDNHIEIKELFTNNILTISYYPSERVGSGRSAEIRMGLRDLISYIAIGDEILFTYDNNHVYIYNITRGTNFEMEDNIYAQIDIDLLRNRVNNINPRPNQVEHIIRTFPRNATLKTYIKRRSNYICEMPNCNYRGFLKVNGETYIEVHHVIPLSEGGEDIMNNTVALCPNCHRALHYASNREEMRQILLDYLINV